MTEELTRAAADASEATGLEVGAAKIDGLWTVRVWPPLDSEEGGMPIDAREGLGFAAALAYLNGLETGARIQRERYAELRKAAHECVWDLERYVKTHGPGPDKRLNTLAKALSELEG